MRSSGFDARLEKLPTALVAKLAVIDEMKGKWEAGAKLSPQILKTLKRSVLVTSTGASTRIEGAQLEDEDVEKLMRGMSLQKFAERDKQEVKGYFELLEQVFDSWQTLSFSESLIKHFHKELLKYVAKDERHRGEYKKQENKVQAVDEETGEVLGTIFETTPAYLTPKEMQELAQWTQQSLRQKAYHPLLVIGNFIVEFLSIHPFQDGNGRLSRVLTNLLLLQAGYEYMPYVSHEKLIEDNKADYYVALRRSQKIIWTPQADISDWLEFFFAIISEQSKMALGLLSGKELEKLLSEKQMEVWQFLQTAQSSAPREIADHTGIAYATVRQALNKLMDLKRIERMGQGRATRYKVLF